MWLLEVRDGDDDQQVKSCSEHRDRRYYHVNERGN